MDRDDLDRGINGLMAALDRVIPGRFSAVLYGSAARGDWLAGKSDVNLLLLVDDASAPALQRLSSALNDWNKLGWTPPLLMARDEWTRAADVFPIEITDMQLAYRVLRGDDPIPEARVDRSDLRRSLEADLRGRLVRLRQIYLRYADNERELGAFAVGTIGAILVLMRCVAVLLDEPPEGDARALTAGLELHLGGDVSVLADIAAHRDDAKWNCPAPTFVRYFDSVRRAVEVVDHFQHGDR